MLQLVYFKTDTSRPAGIPCPSDGGIDFALLGRVFMLDPSSIQLNETGFSMAGLKSKSTWEQIEELFKGDGIHVGTKDDPVMVTGEAPVVRLQFMQPSAGLSSGVPEKLLQELREYLAEQKAKQESKKSVCLSSMSSSIWDTLRQEGLKMIFEDIGSKPKHLSDLPAFDWDDRLKSSG